MIILSYASTNLYKILIRIIYHNLITIIKWREKFLTTKHVYFNQPRTRPKLWRLAIVPLKWKWMRTIIFFILMAYDTDQTFYDKTKPKHLHSLSLFI